MESIGLEKYIKPFLETKDFTVFGQGDEEALEPFIMGYCLEYDIAEIIDSPTSIRNFSKLLISEIQRTKFKNFIKELEYLVNEFGLDYLGSAEKADFERLSITLTFCMEEELQVDKLIRHVRDKLANNFIYENGKYPLAVWKSHIESANVWSVDFLFAIDWELKEDFQG